MLRLITFTVVGMLLLSYQCMSAEITPSGTFNYKWSHDENASGVAYDKLENNGSLIGLDIVEECDLSLIHISEPTRLLSISYAVFCLKKKKRKMTRISDQR